MHPEMNDIHLMLGAIGREEPPEDLKQRILRACDDASPVEAISCERSLELASAYLDEELSPAERDAFEAHVFACDGCYAAFKRMERTSELLRETPPAAAPADLRERIQAAVAEDAAEQSVFTWRRAAKVVGGLAAAAALLAAVFIPRGSDGTDPSAPVVAEAPRETRAVQADEPLTSTESAEVVEERGEAAESGETEAEEAGAAETAIAAAPVREAPRVRSTAPRRSAAAEAPTRPEPARERSAREQPEPAPRATASTMDPEPSPGPAARSAVTDGAASQPERSAPAPEPDPEAVVAEDTPRPVVQPERTPEAAPEPPARDSGTRESAIAAMPRESEDEAAPASAPSPGPETTVVAATPPQPDAEADAPRRSIVPQRGEPREVYRPAPRPASERDELLARMSNGINGSQNPRMDNPSTGIALN